MKIKYLMNPKHNSVGTIDVTLVLADGSELPFTASSDDVESYGREIYQSLIDGDYGEIGDLKK